MSEVHVNIKKIYLYTSGARMRIFYENYENYEKEVNGRSVRKYKKYILIRKYILIYTCIQLENYMYACVRGYTGSKWGNYM